MRAAGNIIIAGAARSGKTILSRRVSAELGLSHIPADALICAFERCFPADGIRHTELLHGEICRNFEDFLVEFLFHMGWIGVPYVLDCFHLLPEQVIRRGLDKNARVVFLGYADVFVEEKLSTIRSFRENNDWTDEVSDEQLSADVETFIEISRTIRNQCVESGLPYFDTGVGFDSALDEAFRFLTSPAGQ